MQIIARQRNDYEWAIYATEMSVQYRHVDFPGRNRLQQVEYLKAARSHKLLVRGKHLMSVFGIINCHIESGSVDDDQFYMCV